MAVWKIVKESGKKNGEKGVWACIHTGKKHAVLLFYAMFFLHLSFFRVSTFGGTIRLVFWNAVGRRVMPGFVLIEKSF
ncbi:hypothetical protein C4580_03345 [Candidatus Woesearchaeota archaeon]|nr:MAG: hypothetical protein C4580_03345 [Candidatus Woesearchaeota archaeon]